MTSAPNPESSMPLQHYCAITIHANHSTLSAHLQRCYSIQNILLFTNIKRCSRPKRLPVTPSLRACRTRRCDQSWLRGQRSWRYRECLRLSVHSVFFQCILPSAVRFNVSEEIGWITRIFENFEQISSFLGLLEFA